MAAADYTSLVQSIYVSYFGRPADTFGLKNFTEQLDALKAPTTARGLTDAYKTNATLRALIDSFGASAESTALYGSASTDTVAFVSSIYNNLLNRAPDFEGLVFWTNEINAGRLTRANASLAIMAGATDNTTPQGLLDAQVVATKVTVAANFTTAIDTGTELAAYTGTAAAAAARDMLAKVTAETVATEFQATVNATIDAIVVASVPTVITNLTAGTDSFTGTSGSDKFIANVAVIINPADGSASNVDTAQAVDVLDGGAGIDSLNFITKGGVVTLPSMTSVEVINGQSLGALTIDTAAIAGVTNLNITKAVGAVDATAAATTDVSIAMKAAGAAVDVAGGKNVVVNLKDVAGAADVVSIGVGGDADPAGTVAVTMTGAAYTAATGNTTLSAVNVTGGSTITVTQMAASDAAAAAADASNATITQGNVTIIGNANTTAVTVKQDATADVADADFTTGGVTETASVKFGVLKAGDSLTVAGLTFTAGVNMTAAEVAATFANLIKGAAYAAPASIGAGDTQSGGSAAKGTYTLIASGWTSGAATGDTVVFASTTAKTDVGDLTPVLVNTSLTSVAPLVTPTNGKPDDAGLDEGAMGVQAGVVSVTDANGTIKTITIDGYATGSATATTSVLETLNLSNSDASAAITIGDTAATFALNLEAVDGSVSFTAAPATLNVKSTGANAAVMTAAATTALNVSGTGVLTAGASDLTAVKAIVVTETAGLSLTGATLTALESVNTTATTGAVTVTINGAQTTYAGGAGKDTVTLATATALTKAINLGAGDDTLSFGALAVTGSTAAVNGGDGTDTLSMSTAAAGGLDGAPVTFITGFERLTINDAGVADSINLANLGFTNYVTTTGSTGTLTLDKLANNGTVVVTAAAATSLAVQVADAATGTADVLNVVLRSAGNLAGGVVTAANVETVNISTVDTSATSKNVDSITLTADTATTVNVSGPADLALTLTGSTKVTTIDGSAMTGALTVTSLNTTAATTIKGGSGADVLSAAAGTTADVLVGGAGNDVLVANAGLDTLTGGAGNDVFVIGTASLNSSSYATITDFAAGDLIQFAGATEFAASKVVQADTAVFQDYANAAMNASGIGEVSWFQFGGNTYIVMDAGLDSTTFTNGEDFVVKLTGIVDLTNASFNNTHNTIAL